MAGRCSNRDPRRSKDRDLVPQNAGVDFDPLFLALVAPLATDGCGEGSLAPEIGWVVTKYATSAAFEEVLLCLPERADAMTLIKTIYPGPVAEFVQSF